MKEQDEAKQGWEDLSNEENYKNYGKLEEGKQEKVLQFFPVLCSQEIHSPQGNSDKLILS